MFQMWQIGTLEQKYVYFLAVPSAKKTYSFCCQIARRVRLVPIPSHLWGLANVEEVVAATKQSEEREVEEAGRKSPRMQRQMIIEFDEIWIVFSYL
jgi:hypothetical protein